MRDNRSRMSKAVELTDEMINSLPQSKHIYDFKYDSKVPGLAVRRTHTNKPPSFHLLLDKRTREAASAMTGRKVGQYATIGYVSLSEARRLAEELRATYNIAVAKMAASQKFVPDGAPNIPQDILVAKVPVENPNYDSLLNVLMDAYGQATQGKGAARHGEGVDFEDQDMFAIMDRVGVGFPLGQAIKKLCEGRRLNVAACRQEWLGAIVYIAGAICWLDKKNNEQIKKQETQQG